MAHMELPGGSTVRPLDLARQQAHATRELLRRIVVLVAAERIEGGCVSYERTIMCSQHRYVVVRAVTKQRAIVACCTLFPQPNWEESSRK